MNLHMGKSVQMTLSWSFKEQVHTTREIGHMFAVSIYVVNVQEVWSVLTGMRCLRQENCHSKILKTVTMGMSNRFLYCWCEFLLFPLMLTYLYWHVSDWVLDLNFSGWVREGWFTFLLISPWRLTCHCNTLSVFLNCNANIGWRTVLYHGHQILYKIVLSYNKWE